MESVFGDRQPRIGVISPAEIAGMDGLALFRRMIAGELPAASIGPTMNFTLVGVENGRAQFEGIPGPAHLNPIGTVHGGWMATLLDSCMGCAVHTTLAAGEVYTTLEFKVNLVRAVTPKTGRLRAEGVVTYRGGRIATADGRLSSPDGKLYALGNTTCLIMPAPSAQGAKR
jgi:uncharacterized protein (TIGR00369 family)